MDNRDGWDDMDDDIREADWREAEHFGHLIMIAMFAVAVIATGLRLVEK